MKGKEFKQKKKNCRPMTSSKRIHNRQQITIACIYIYIVIVVYVNIQITNNTGNFHIITNNTNKYVSRHKNYNVRRTKN